jgi:hypothetical protein
VKCLDVSTTEVSSYDSRATETLPLVLPAF